MSYKSNRKQVETNAMKVLMRNMNKAAVFAESHCKRIISRGNVTGLDPSLPGEPPKVRTGTLRSSIVHVIKREGNHVSGYFGVRKGPAEDYGLYLEFGTSKMPARPFLRKTVMDNKKKIGRIISEGR